MVKDIFYAKLGWVGIFGPTVQQFNLDANTTSNGLRLINYAAMRSINFQHLDIHKATLITPDRSTFNQIDHIVIDGRHISSVVDVRTFRGPNIDSDHNLVADKFRLRICASTSARSSALHKLDIRKLRSQRTAEAFTAQHSDKLHRSSSNLSDIGGLWLTSPTACTLLWKQSLVSSGHSNEIKGTMKSASRQLLQDTPHTRQRCSQPVREPFLRTV